MIELRPNYNLESVIAMREELTAVGFTELMTAGSVDEALAYKAGSTLFVVNSVCGCAAGNARPGVAFALQHRAIPDRLFTVFAGMEKAAVQRLREALAPNPPSSPCLALFKDGGLVYMMHRSDIEQRSAEQVADLLGAEFDKHCAAEGPSIPREQFEKLAPGKFCGSKIPAYQG